MMDFTSDPRCMKCGGRAVMEYKRHPIERNDGDFDFDFDGNVGQKVIVEYIACTCERCGFRWKMAVLNPGD